MLSKKNISPNPASPFETKLKDFSKTYSSIAENTNAKK